MKYKLKNLTGNVVVHTPTEEEAKELLEILHESGYKWLSGNSLDSLNNPFAKVYYIDNNKMVQFGSLETAIENRCTILTLAEFKSKYCMEDKPRFKVGDKVKIKDSYYKEELHGSIGIVRREASPFSFYVEIDNTIYQVVLNDLEPYTEQTEELKEDNFIKTENMETKELNLKEILKDCPKGVEFYSLLEGSVIFEGINPREREFGEKPIMCNEGYYCSNGAYQDKPNAACCLWPSRALYEQYPLGPCVAWQKWVEEQKKWGLQISFIGDDGWSGVETHLTFKSEEEYQMAVKEIKSVIGKYSKK